MHMRTILIRIILLLAGSSVAAWLRMFDQSLFLQSWANLAGKPFALWLAAILISPLVELVHLWPAYLVGGILYTAVARVRFGERLRVLPASLLGTATGAIVFLLVATLNQEWIMRPASQNTKLLLIYMVAGTCYGWTYYLWIMRRQLMTAK
jgi:hypothetical protein